MLQIGRYQLSLQSIVSLKKRDGLKGFFFPGYDALLSNGQTVHFNEAEKKAYDEAAGIHQATMYVYGVARAAGLRG